MNLCQAGTLERDMLAVASSMQQGGNYLQTFNLLPTVVDAIKSACKYALGPRQLQKLGIDVMLAF